MSETVKDTAIGIVAGILLCLPLWMMDTTVISTQEVHAEPTPLPLAVFIYRCGELGVVAVDNPTGGVAMILPEDIARNPAVADYIKSLSEEGFTIRYNAEEVFGGTCL